MFNEKVFKEVKTIIKFMFVIFFIMGLSYLSITLLMQFNVNKIQKSGIISNEQIVLDVERVIISNKMNQVVSDLLYINDSLQLCNGDNNYEDLERQWLAFSNRKKIYDQIRFIDLDGNEVIRVNYKDDGAEIVDRLNLQNKKDRYYFKDTISLNKNQIYISKLDLNIEGDEIEQPIKPMIRLSKPYYGKDGKLEGIVMLNYNADDMLRQVKEIALTAHGSVFLLNADGYWLYNSEDSSYEWTFMYSDKVNESFACKYPNEWETMNKKEEGSLSSVSGVFNYTNVLTNNDFSLDSGENDSLIFDAGDWYIVSYIAPETPNGKLFTSNIGDFILAVMFKNYMVYFSILVVAFIFAVIMTISKIRKDRLKYFSEYDVMTGVYNRRAGFDKLNQLYKNSLKNRSLISICFIDINGLKGVNDFLGHEAGDELILSVVDGIKKNIRENDFVARLGGDEFLIIFEELDEEGAERIWNRILQEYDQINQNEDRKYIISASHGIETFKYTIGEYVDLIVNRADEKMYNEKRMIKKELEVIKNT